MCSILSQLAREERLSIIENPDDRSPEDQAAVAKAAEHGPGIGPGDHRHDRRKPAELASRNLPNVLVVEPKHADPMSLVFYKKILVTKAALAKIEEMYA